jgi:hypothetical protein
MISGRELSRDEITVIWAIDRTELIDAVYYLDKGELRSRPEHHDVQGWPPGEAEKYTPILEACHDHGGWLYGLFDDQRLIGAAVLESHRIGRAGDQLQLPVPSTSATGIGTRDGGGICSAWPRSKPDDGSEVPVHIGPLPREPSASTCRSDAG